MISPVLIAECYTVPFWASQQDLHRPQGYEGLEPARSSQRTSEPAAKLQPEHAGQLQTRLE